MVTYHNRIGYILGLYWDNGKEMETTTMGLYRDYNRVYILGLYWDNGKENGNYYDGIGFCSIQLSPLGLQ